MTVPEPKPKKRRFEGFIHQKIDPNLLKAMTFLSKTWGAPLEEVATRAIQDTATREALEVQSRPAKLKRPTARPNASAARSAKVIEPQVRIVRDEALELKLVEEKRQLEKTIQKQRREIKGVESERADLRARLQKIRHLAAESN